jgi:CRP-like cAMP-binding protein
VETIDLGPDNNKLLAALPRKDFQLLAPHLSTVRLVQGAVLFEQDQQIDEVFFPHCGMISMVVMMRDGNSIETTTIGREGVVGAMSGFGSRISGTRAIAHLPTFASRISAFELRNAVEASSVIADLCMRFSELLLGQAEITAACNALHQIEARLCRWLLQTRDRAERDTITLTQEFLAEILGVRRTSVTEAAHKLQIDGVIGCHRGVITILDLEKLKATSCECYEMLRESAAQLLPYERNAVA